MLKIGLVCPYSFSYYGGVQNHVLGLYKELKKRGYKVKIFVPKGKIGEYYRNKDIIFIGGAFNLFFESTFPLSFGLTVGGILINDYFKKANFDVLHFHNPTTPFLPWQILAVSKATNIATFHADLIDHKVYKSYQFLFKNIYKNLLPKIKGFIAVSSSAKESLIAVYPKAKVKIIPNGIDVSFFSRGKPIKNYKDGKFNILSVGRLDERKGVIYLIKAFAKLKKRIHQKLRLILVGDGPEKFRVKTLIKELRLEKDVEIKGEVKQKLLPQFYKSADLFIAPATHGESFGLILLEAMAAGVPIIASANRGYKEILNEVGEDCLFKPRDIKSLVNKAERLIKDSKKREELKKWGESRVLNFDWSKIADNVLNFYKEITEGRK